MVVYGEKPGLPEKTNLSDLVNKFPLYIPESGIKPRSHPSELSVLPTQPDRQLSNSLKEEF